jgi:phosphodiesterase/alkaline phosphatase D-like protein
MFRRSLVLAAIALCASALGQDGGGFVDTQVPAAPAIGGVWCGNVTPTSVTVTIRLTAPGLRVRLQVSRADTLAQPVFSSVVTTAATLGNTAKLTVQGLLPDTDYFYGIEVGGVLRTELVTRGRFHTFPLGRASFRMAFASCGDFRAANQTAFAAIMAERPLFFLHTGDLHYSDTNSTNPDEYRYNYDNVLGHREQGALFRSMPVVYVWDDHDFSGNDSDSTSTGRDPARAVYRERVPHYPLGAAGGTIGQAFTVGRVRFIITDQRSGSTPATARDTASKSKLGTAQKAWFKQELINARDNGFPLIVWVCPDPWIGAAIPGDDGWPGYTTERTEIANFIRDNRVTNLTLLSGDMHALAFDDGTNSDYATGGGAPLTVLQAAALTQDGSIKGGPYSSAVLPGSPHYGILEVYDNGGPSVACRFLGMHATEGRKLTHIFSSSSGALKEHAIVNISTLAKIASGNDTLISGFVISGASNRTLLVRAVGPTLSAFGVTDSLPQPQLSVYQGDRLISSNSAWAGPNRAAAAPLTDAFDRAGAFRLVNEDSRDAALILSLPPGAYTVQVRSGTGTGGTALLEVYEL